MYSRNVSSCDHTRLKLERKACGDLELAEIGPFRHDDAESGRVAKEIGVSIDPRRHPSSVEAHPEVLRERQLHSSPQGEREGRLSMEPWGVEPDPSHVGAHERERHRICLPLVGATDKIILYVQIRHLDLPGTQW